MSESVKKAFDIVWFLADRQDGIKLSDISRAMNINKTTAFRYLETLESLNIIEKQGNKYALGLGLFELGNKVQSKALIVDRMRPLLVHLSEEVNETVNMAQLHEDHALYLDKIESNRSLQIQSKIGHKLPLYCTALGKSILSVLPREKAEALIAKMTFHAKTTHTILNAEELQKQVADVKTRGYATDDEEFEMGLKCVAVPLAMPELHFYGGLSISGPVFRFNDSTIAHLAQKLMATAYQIHGQLKNQ